MKRDSVIILLLRVWKLLSSKRKYQLLALFCLMMITAFAELVSLASIIPFLAILSNPDSFTTNIYFSRAWWGNV